MDQTFAQLDDLVLHLKGLVLVRKYRERNGAESSELAMFSEEIERVRDRLASFVRNGSIPHAARS